MTTTVARTLQYAAAALLAGASPIALPAADSCETLSDSRYDVTHDLTANKRGPWDKFARNLGARFAMADEGRADDPKEAVAEERPTLEKSTPTEPASPRAQVTSQRMKLMLLWRLLGGQSRSP